MIQLKTQTVVKIMGDYEAIEKLLDQLADFYNLGHSLIKPNDRGGHHVFVRLYEEVRIE